MTDSPTPGDMWVDSDSDDGGYPRRVGGRRYESILILRQVKSSTSSLVVWELLVTREDRTTFVDWENTDSVQEWYDETPPWLQRLA